MLYIREYIINGAGYINLQFQISCADLFFMLKGICITCFVQYTFEHIYYIHNLEMTEKIFHEFMVIDILANRTRNAHKIRFDSETQYLRIQVYILPILSSYP